MQAWGPSSGPELTFAGVDPDFGLDEFTVGIDEIDSADRRSAENGGKPDEVIEGGLTRRVEDPRVTQGLQARLLVPLRWRQPRIAFDRVIRRLPRTVKPTV